MTSTLRRLRIAGRCAAGLSLFVPALANAQASAPVKAASTRPAGAITPQPLRAGSRAVISYDPSVPGAAFRPGDRVDARLRIAFPDSTSTRDIRMHDSAGVFVAVIAVPAGASAIHAQFTAGRRDDRAAQAGALVADARGVPGRRGYLAAYRGPGDSIPYDERIRRELALYPDEYGAYPEKWMYATSKALRDSTIRSDMAKLIAEEGKPRPDLDYALAYGYMRMNDEPSARKAIRRMAARDIKSQWMGDAILDYQLTVYQKQITGDGPDEVEELKWRAVESNPTSSLATLLLSEDAGDPKIQESTFKPVALAWIRNKPRDPLGYLYLAALLETHRTSTAEARAAIGTALSLLLDPGIRTQRPADWYLDDAYHIAASLALRDGDNAAALAYVKAAESLEREMSPGAYVLESKIWQAGGDSVRAERALVIAWERGSTEAADSLSAHYMRIRGTMDGFAEYLAARSAALDNASGRHPAAGPISAVTLAGDTIDLKRLRGKVTVLNFWYIACIPCRVEMPGLNQLVADYAGKDVTFVGIATDEAPALRTFLEKTPFNYRTVPAGKDIAADYGVMVYPTHVVIDAEGRVIMRVSGEDPKHITLLRLLIDRALASRGRP